jgi:NAD(P)-dependent dehydrogenase (short-subunit alcohol dehydrogenase family)
MKILITGSSSGIGLYLARFYLDRGDEVWALARRPQQFLWTNEKTQNTERLHFLTADVNSPDQCQEAASQIQGEINAIIHCAGIQGKIGPFLNLTPSEWAETISCNLGGTVNILQAFHPVLKSSGGDMRAKIICLSGGGATQARVNFSAYAVAKTAIVRLVEILAHEWIGDAIDINALAPGALPTEMTIQTINAGAASAGEKEVSDAERILQSGEMPWAKMQAMVAYLLSPASNGVSGRLIAAQWDGMHDITQKILENSNKDIYCLRRVGI